MEQLTVEQLKELVVYNSITGMFSRKVGKPISSKPNGDGYLRVMVDKKHYLAHRLAWFYINGVMPTFIDHIDGNRSNNAISNLREVSSQENQRNLTIASNNTSGTTGVSFNKERSKWEAKIQVDGKTIHLGRYLDKEDAILARKQGEVKYNFHKNHGKDKQ
ncbi:MAG: HNH endonuclease [Thermoprotei archaeon]|nr:MAG: HNH endonuclease [Thermoprotei archaeon]